MSCRCGLLFCTSNEFLLYVMWRREGPAILKRHRSHLFSAGTALKWDAVVTSNLAVIKWDHLCTTAGIFLVRIAVWRKLAFVFVGGYCSMRVLRMFASCACVIVGSIIVHAVLLRTCSDHAFHFVAPTKRKRRFRS